MAAGPIRQFKDDRSIKNGMQRANRQVAVQIISDFGSSSESRTAQQISESEVLPPQISQLDDSILNGSAIMSAAGASPNLNLSAIDIAAAMHDNSMQM